MYYTHGLTHHPLYKIWNNMLARCYNPKAPKFLLYGARGIVVCERWQGDTGIANFIADMGERPPGTTLDRRDNEGNYEPSNCRWATAIEQNRNRRLVGVHFTKKTQKWRANIRVGGKMKYLGEFISRDEALAVRAKAKEELWLTPQKED